MSYISPALLTDFYQLTMSAAYHAKGFNGPATFSLFVHDLPKQRGFMVAAGLEKALDYLEEFRFSKEDIAYLASLDRFDSGFLKMLAGLGFTGRVRAMPEGTACFAGEPLLEITAPLIEAQLVETYLINTLNLHTTLASKAVRCTLAAQGRICVDFGLRRTHGADAGMAAARSSALAGFAGTSNVAASQELEIMPVGTMAHAFVEAFGNELTAFRVFSEVFPDHSFLLIDTYDSLRGLDHAITMAGELAAEGHTLLGVRLDSGDLAGMSQEVRRRLDAAGLKQVLVAASGNLDETAIAALLTKGAKIDIFGVGTKMGNSADIPYLDFAYKLVSYEGRPTLKLSEGKETWVGAKQVWRVSGSDGLAESDLLGLAVGDNPGRPLLETVMENGRRLAPSPPWREAKKRCAREVEQLPAQCLSLEDPLPIPLAISQRLRDLQEKTRNEVLARQNKPSEH